MNAECDISHLHNPNRDEQIFSTFEQALANPLIVTDGPKSPPIASIAIVVNLFKIFLSTRVDKNN